MAFLFLPLTLPLERIRYVHAAAEAAVLSAVPVDADVCLPRIVLGGAHLHAQFAADTAALDAGRTDLRAVYRALRFTVEFVFIGQAAVPVPLLVRGSVPVSLSKTRNLNFYLTKIITCPNIIGLKTPSAYTFQFPKSTAKRKRTLDKLKYLMCSYYYSPFSPLCHILYVGT